MIGLVLVTHGRLAREFVQAVEDIVGPQKAVAEICIGPDDDMEQRRNDIIDGVKRVNEGDGVVLLTDMFGGTPSNLAMLIKLVSLRENESLQVAVTEAQAAGRKYINVASQLLAEDK